MRERSGRQDVPERKRPEGLARLASAANATNESGGEAEIAGWVWAGWRGCDAEFTERSSSGSQRSAVIGISRGRKMLAMSASDSRLSVRRRRFALHAIGSSMLRGELTN